MKINRSVTIYNQTFDDAVYPSSGTTAYNQIIAKQTLHSTDTDGGEWYIPFHAIARADVVVSSEEVSTTDDLCGGDGN